MYARVMVGPRLRLSVSRRMLVRRAADRGRDAARRKTYMCSHVLFPDNGLDLFQYAKCVHSVSYTFACLTLTKLLLSALSCCRLLGGRIQPGGVGRETCGGHPLWGVHG